MTIPDTYDAYVIGAGPNGLAAAITLATAGRSVLVLEARSDVGGSVRSVSLTQAGFVHDFGASIFPMALASPFFRSLDLEAHGLEWIHPDAVVAHPLDTGTAAVQTRSLRETAATLGKDGKAYTRLMEPLLDRWEALVDEVLRPLVHWPAHPLLMGRFGLRALRSVTGLAERLFETAGARALLGGHATHSSIPLTDAASASFGLILGLMGHAVGWPMPRGGAGRLTAALHACLASRGGEVLTDRPIRSLGELPPGRPVLCDVTPRQFLALAGERTPGAYRRALERYRYGPGVFKLDYALHEPIPWTAPACRRAGTVHLGGTLDELAASERAVFEGRPPERPFVLLAQHSLFDPTRAPDGAHTAWAYCHVPNGSTADMTERMERQIERFAPGFRACIRARHAMGPADLNRHNANLVGGDINGGLQNLRQMIARPVWSLHPYRTPLPGVYLCSSSTPPGGGTHGMSGHLAARSLLDHQANTS